MSPSALHSVSSLSGAATPATPATPGKRWQQYFVDQLGLPKVEALRVAFPKQWRKQAVTVYPVG